MQQAESASSVTHLGPAAREPIGRRRSSPLLRGKGRSESQHCPGGRLLGARPVRLMGGSSCRLRGIFSHLMASFPLLGGQGCRPLLTAQHGRAPGHVPPAGPRLLTVFCSDCTQHARPALRSSHACLSVQCISSRRRTLRCARRVRPRQQQTHSPSGWAVCCPPSFPHFIAILNYLGPALPRGGSVSLTAAHQGEDLPIFTSRDLRHRP